MGAVAAVGDAPNDIEMLQSAGRSAAMGSAPREVTEAASIVVPPSSRDGVIDALRAFFPSLWDQRRIWGPAHRWTVRGGVSSPGREVAGTASRT
jgi:3-deoxy-D-manno-octulosonate 8-phosphate phosphatase KdsC-like HAD superfamily phosphatase